MGMRTQTALSLAVLLSFACTSKGSDAAERQPDTASVRDSVAGVAAATMTESSAIGLLAMTHSADSATGALGVTGGSTRDIQDFGRMITREHHALHREAEDLARGLHIDIATPRVPPDSPPAEMTALLKAAQSGPSWDRALLNYAISMHESAMENNARALAATKSPAVRHYIEASVPILQKHLDKARALLRIAAKRPTPAPVQPKKK
jgi:predicted outer membrane protein